MSTSKLYTLLIASSLLFNVACDGDDTVTNDGGTAGGTDGGGIAGTTDGGTTDAGTMVAGMDAGTMVAGTMVAGMEAGTMVAGTMVAGMEAGTMVGGTEPLPERMGLGDTDALSCTGDYCPSARLSGLEIPANSTAATEGGCRLAGEQNGATLGGLLALAGDIDTNSFVQPDENGDISLLLLNHLVGWAAGATGNAAGQLTSNFYIGSVVDGGFFIDPASINESGEPYISFPGTTVTDGLLSTPDSTFALSLPLLDGFNLELSLESASLEGDVTVDGTGFALSKGVLGGYLTKDSLIGILNGIYEVCDSATPPSLCDTVGMFLSGNAEADLGLLQTFVQFDTIVNDGEIVTCSSDRAAECNAVSLCLFVEMEPAEIQGIAAE